MTYTAKAQFVNGLEINVGTRSHTIKVDQSAERGGTNKGMNPMELLLSSIATCLTMTVLLATEKADLKVEDISVKVEGDRDACVRPGLNVIRTTVNVKTNVPSKTMEQFIREIALNAPVVESVRNAVTFEEPTLVIQRAD